MGCHSLLQGIFPTQLSNPGFPHCRQLSGRQKAVPQSAGPWLSSVWNNPGAKVAHSGVAYAAILKKLITLKKCMKIFWTWKPQIKSRNTGWKHSIHNPEQATVQNILPHLPHHLVFLHPVSIVQPLSHSAPQASFLTQTESHTSSKNFSKWCFTWLL